MTAPTISNSKVELKELFDFLTNPRDDVRKMASSGLSSLSENNNELNSFLAHTESSVAVLSSFITLQNGGHRYLGDILTVIINTAADASVAEALSRGKIVQRIMRLLDSLESTSDPVVEKSAPALKEMTLMALNNLTASDVTAVQYLLQTDDEDLAGFFIGRLHTLYSKQPDDYSETGSSSSEPARDIRKWILQIVLNVTRTPDGQRLVLAEDWPETFTAIVDQPTGSRQPPILMSLVWSILKNCASIASSHPRLLEFGLVPKAIDRVHCVSDGQYPTVVMSQVEFIAGMLQSESGMECLESINAKKYLVEASAQAAKARESRVEEIADGDIANKAEGKSVLPEEVASFIDHHLLPYLDDIQDAYVQEENYIN